MALSETRNISLIGFMGTGKSSVGKALGRQTGRRVVDIDQWIESQKGRKIREIFEQEGEAYFRELETLALAEVVRLAGAVITTGGGAVLNPVNLETLKKTGWIISLSASPETIYERVKDSRHRPLLKDGSRQEVTAEICRLLEARNPFYALADYEFKTDGLAPDQVAHLILETLEREKNK